MRSRSRDSLVRRTKGGPTSTPTPHHCTHTPGSAGPAAPGQPLCSETLVSRPLPRGALSAKEGRAWPLLGSSRIPVEETAASAPRPPLGLAAATVISSGSQPRALRGSLRVRFPARIWASPGTSPGGEPEPSLGWAGAAGLLGAWQRSWIRVHYPHLEQSGPPGYLNPSWWFPFKITTESPCYLRVPADRICEREADDGPSRFLGCARVWRRGFALACACAGPEQRPAPAVRRAGRSTGTTRQQGGRTKPGPAPQNSSGGTLLLPPPQGHPAKEPDTLKSREGTLPEG
ncbi:uncharacterized protein [Macaca fascicularis]|uniref:uncharacterized protein n=1 Tax=Macaca fascicularis TaxID=9541 RepID=UPI0032B046B9